MITLCINLQYKVNRYYFKYIILQDIILHIEKTKQNYINKFYNFITRIDDINIELKFI